AFLLIIFFMLLSEFSKDKDLPIELPRSDQVKKTEIVVVARVAVAADGVIYFDGDQVDSAKDIEWGVRALLSKTVADEQRHVQFKCDASLSKEQFEPVLKAIAEGGGIIEAVGEDQ
ncbi:biopolymer transporter ExbD, partial [Rubripirellula sp.]|nr:biopolymer transporter ExbD [Rubripirellula sp.]